jgi:hypothetical protein
VPIKSTQKTATAASATTSAIEVLRVSLLSLVPSALLPLGVGKDGVGGGV